MAVFAVAGSENVRHRDVKCFGSLAGAAGTAGSHGAAAAALTHVLISFLQEWRLRSGGRALTDSVTPAGSGMHAGGTGGRTAPACHGQARRCSGRGRQA